MAIFVRRHDMVRCGGACRATFPGGQSAEGRRIPGLSRIREATGFSRWSFTEYNLE
jgi:hypothetical protein